MSNKILIINFSDLRQYPEDLLKNIGLEGKELEVLSIHRAIHKNKLKESFKKILKKENITGSLEFKRLQRHLISCKLGEASIVDITPEQLRFFPGNMRELMAFYKKVKLIVSGKTGPIDLFGVESSGYILDSLQRFVPKFRVDRGLCLSNRFLILLFVLKIETVTRWISERKDFKSLEAVIINHSVYFESGWIAQFLSQEYGIPIIHIKSMQRHVVQLNMRKKHRWFESSIGSAEVGYRASKKRLPWYDTHSISELGDLRNKDIDCHRVLVAMHAFSDANGMHWHPDILYQTYYHWVRETLGFAISNLAIQYTFRIHPNTFKYYKKDLLIIDSLFNSTHENVRLEDPRTSKGEHFEKSVPIVITCRGSIALELACSGIKTVCAYRPHCPDGGYILPRSKEEYFEYLEGKVEKSSHYLTDDEVKLANSYKANLNSLFRD